MTEPLWHVFISHSTKGTNGVAKRLLEKLKSALPPTYRPVVDEEEINVGDDWVEWIVGNLHRCHLGIVLLDSKAAQSAWVRVEATVLRFQQEFQGRVFGVLIGVDRDEVRKKTMYDSFRTLLGKQLICGEDPTAEAEIEAEATRLCAMIMTRLGACSEGLSKDDVRRIRSLANSFKLPDRDSVQTLVDLHFPELVDSTKKHPLFHTEWLAKYVLDDQLGQSAVAAITDATYVRERVHYTRPILLSSWLSWSEVQSIRIDEHPVPGPRAPVLLTDEPAVAELYVARATGCIPSFGKVGRLDPVADGVRSVAEQVDRLFAPDGYLKCKLRHDGTCEEHGKYRNYVLVGVVGGVKLSARVAGEIHRRCPMTVVVLMIPPHDFHLHGVDQIREWLGAAYRSVEPIDPERKARYDAARDVIEEAMNR